MRHNFSLFFSFLLVCSDFVVIMAAFTIAYILRVNINVTDAPVATQIIPWDFVKSFFVMIPFSVVIFALLGLYSRSVYERKLNEASRILVATFVSILFLISYSYITDKALFPGKLVPVFAFAAATVLLIVERYILRRLKRYMFKQGFGVSRALMIGDTSASVKLIDHLSNTQLTGYEVVGLMGRRALIPDKMDIEIFQSVKSALASLEELGVQTIIQTQIFDDEQTNIDIQQAAASHHIAYKFIPTNDTLYAANNQIEIYGSFPVVSVHPTALIGWGRLTKRMLDITLALLVLILTSPIMLLVSIFIKLVDPKGPIIFKQDRLTRFDAVFKVFKFRSMKQKYSGRDEVSVFKELGMLEAAEEYENSRGRISAASDPRLLPLGNFLRATGIDELPQLFNVLKGDISLVGPRAVVEKHAAQYKSNRSLMLSVKTGITGLAQVSGRDDLSLEERVKLDIFYVQNWSFWMDLQIIARTVWVLGTRTGFKAK
jgi:exopolysaccharide biosynthesis polyprenyl glycosylphosphotransferase